MLSFAGLVLLGTLGLKLIPGLHYGEELSWLDAMFTATSAVCVTGLVVADTATHFTLWGQVFVLILIQVGGLGIITFASMIIMTLGRRLSLRSEALSLEAASVVPNVRPVRLLRDIVVFTLSIEAVGAMLLYLSWVPRWGWRGAAWPAVFHSVSAFCNAGFSTFSDSLMGMQRNPMSLTVIMLLIVLGGLGFLTLEELYLWHWARRRQQRFRMSLHSRLVLVTTVVLLLVGWLAFGVLEWNRTLKGLGPLDKLVNALFLSVSPRTAGFNNIDYTDAAVGTNFLTILLMAIGGSPGSMAGGLKTTTFALIGLLAWSRFRRREIVSIADRSVPEETIQRAMGLFVVALSVMTLGLLIVATIETESPGAASFLAYMFEIVSAFNTVGVSMGVTPELGTISKGMIILLMFIGRVGPLAFAAALALPREPVARQFRYAYEDVVIG